MPTSYLTHEVIQKAEYPSWSYTWPSEDGCYPGFATLYNAFDGEAGLPNPSTLYYEPLTEQVVRGGATRKGRRNAYPPFRMTPYFTRRTGTRQHLIRQIDGNYARVIWRQYGHSYKPASSCVKSYDWNERVGPVYNSWYVNSTSPPGGTTHYDLNEWDQSEINDARQSCMDAAAVESLQSYDALTELAEAREIPAMVVHGSSVVSSILKSLRNKHTLSNLRRAAHWRPRDLVRSTSKALRDIGNDWMAYRYGIMPLVYSYHDIVKTIHRGMNVRDRKSRLVSPRSTGSTLPPSGSYSFSQIEGSITFAATTFLHYYWNEVTRLSGVSMNPLVTAWELIPYSFVVDWFCNMGDSIIRATTNPNCGFHCACISQRSNYSKNYYYHPANSSKSLTVSVYKCSNSNSWTPPSEPPIVLSNPGADLLYKEEFVDAYQRDLFDVNAAHLTFGTSINWKRLLDSAAMATNFLMSLMRGIRR